MAKNMKTGVPKKSLAKENAELRKLVDMQSQSAQVLASRLASVAPQLRTGSGADLMVGVRNISDNTIGIPSPFPGELELHLHADTGEMPDPNRAGVISHAWWQRLRKSQWVGRGLLTRDDSVLGESYVAAPPDRPEDIHPDAVLNAVLDPKAWIESRTEEQLRTDIGKITSKDSLQRLRRAVNDVLKVLETGFKSAATPVENPAKSAIEALPMKYRLVDELTTSRIEA